MRRLWMVGCLLVATAGPVAAQDRPNREMLLRQVVERFMENYRAQAGLTDEQNERFRAALRRSFEERRETQRTERDAWRALEGQMRPGVAADPDSLEALIGAIVDARARSIERLRAELDEFATFLNSVQRAQLLISMERLQRNAEEIIRRRLEQGARRGGGRQNR